MPRAALFCSLSILVLGAALHAAAAEAGRTLLYVDNSLGSDITVIDLSSLKVAGVISVGEHPHGLCAPADGRRLFVTVESEKNLKTVDTATGKVVDAVSLTGTPNECAATPDGHYVAVPIRDGNRVDIVDTIQKKIVKSLPVRTPHNAFNPGSNTDMYVSSMGNNEIARIDLTKMEYTAHIPTGGIPRPYAISGDEKTLYVALTKLHGFAIVDIPSGKVSRKVELPPAPPLNCPLEVDTPTHGLALTPDGTHLWVTSLADSGVYAYDVKTEEISSMSPVGKCPNWIAFSPDGKYGAVSNSDTEDCSILDVQTRREVARVKVGKGPKRVLVVRIGAK
jgi:YVTN family beta-propeller protein